MASYYKNMSLFLNSNNDGDDAHHYRRLMMLMNDDDDDVGVIFCYIFKLVNDAAPWK